MAAVIVVAAAKVRDAFNVPDLIAAADHTGHTAFLVPAAALKFDLIEGDAEPMRANLVRPAAIIKVDITKTDGMCLVHNRPATGTNGPAFQTADFRARLAILIHTIVVVAAIVSIVGIPAAASIDVEPAIIGLDRYGCSNSLGGLLISKGWSREEQWRRKSKRGCSRCHDTIYHVRRETHPFATWCEDCVSEAFIYSMSAI